MIGGAAGLAVYWGVPTAWAGIGWLRAPLIQRNQARAELEKTKSLDDLVDLENQLRLNRASNRKALEDVKARRLTGPLGDDDNPWVRSQSEQLQMLVEGAGLPELVPRLTLQNPHLSTWEEVRQAATALDKKIGEVLQDDLFAGVRRLVGIVDDLRREETP